MQKGWTTSYSVTEKFLLDVQFKIKNNPYYQRYIRENSYWYKILNREPNRFKEFEEQAKERYGLRPADKINRMLETMEMLQTLMSSFK